MILIENFAKRPKCKRLLGSPQIQHFSIIKYPYFKLCLRILFYIRVLNKHQTRDKLKCTGRIVLLVNS